MERTFRLFDFNIYNEKSQPTSSDEDSVGDEKKYKDSNNFLIQMFGINEKGESCSIVAEDFKPFFYVKVGDNWTIETKNQFLNFVKKSVGKYYENSISDCKLIKRKKLYGFDGGKEHKFIILQFNNVQVFNKAKLLNPEPVIPELLMVIISVEPILNTYEFPVGIICLKIFVCISVKKLASNSSV